MAYTHIGLEERQCIEKMYKSGQPVKAIAAVTGRSLPTLYRELSRCPAGKYTAEEAQLDAENNCQKSQIAGKQKQREINRRTYIKVIRSCLQLKPDATIEEITRVSGYPIERVEKYYDAVKATMKDENNQ